MTPASIVTATKVQQLIAENLGVNVDDVKPSASLQHDLGADSLDCIEINMNVEEEFDMLIDDATAEKLITVQDYINLVEMLTK